MIMAVAGSATGTVVTTAGKNVFAGLKDNAFFGIVMAMTDGKINYPLFPEPADNFSGLLLCIMP